MKKLAFVIAAYLDSEILVIDEVLADGIYNSRKNALKECGMLPSTTIMR